MDTARQFVRDGCCEGTAVITARQLAGRGRLSRTWLSPEGSVSMSVVLYPPVERLPFLVMMAGIAAAEALDSFTDSPVSLKWPNDIISGDLKLGGILVECGTSDKRLYAVIGIGLNVNVTVQEFPEIADIATSLADLTGQRLDESRVASEILRHLEQCYRFLDNDTLFTRWRRRLNTIGRPVTARMTTAVVNGVAEDVRPDGSLVIRTPTGQIHVVTAGDVSLRTDYGSKPTVSE